ncbi:hypothetical protein DL93DRAFT_1142035 [Clavulina sp. PMI_390]|nr:hypothetical protein DL93DRAFT_1142035 [Clavulina sp. PMI_390]
MHPSLIFIVSSRLVSQPHELILSFSLYISRHTRLSLTIRYHVVVHFLLLSSTPYNHQICYPSASGFGSFRQQTLSRALLCMSSSYLSTTTQTDIHSTYCDDVGALVQDARQSR